jgi:hypothetical protein
MSNAITSHGTLVKRNGTAIGELRDITMPSLTRNTFDTSNQNDSDDSYTIGIRRKGDLTFGINFLPSGETTHGATAGLIKAWTDGSKDLWQGIYPDGASWYCSGYTVGIAPKAPVDGALAADITVKLTNGFIFTP